VYFATDTTELYIVAGSGSLVKIQGTILNGNITAWLEVQDLPALKVLKAIMVLKDQKAIRAQQASQALKELKARKVPQLPRVLQAFSA